MRDPNKKKTKKQKKHAKTPNGAVLRPARGSGSAGTPNGSGPTVADWVGDREPYARGHTENPKKKNPEICPK